MMQDESIKKEFKEQFDKLDQKNKDLFSNLADITGICLTDKCEQKCETPTKSEEKKIVETKNEDYKKEDVVKTYKKEDVEKTTDTK